MHQPRGIVAPFEHMTGYLHRAYAAALSEFGQPRTLPRSAGQVLIRTIPGTTARDAIGCYPLFACADWSGLSTDLDELGAEVVSIALVTDPFGDFRGPEFLRRCFPDVVRPFKEHFVVDLTRPRDATVSRRHHRQIRKAVAVVDVHACEDPLSFSEDWRLLYSMLVARHGVRGLRAFSPRSLTDQLTVPGLTMLRATHDGTCVGMTLWYTQGTVAYYHLGAYPARGYRFRASFAVFWYALQHFADHGVQWLNLGAGAGIHGDAHDGLSQFKRGWSTETRTAYFCGRIFDRGVYAQLSRGRVSDDYFPAYRAGEFN